MFLRMPRLIWVFPGHTPFCWFCRVVAQFLSDMSDWLKLTVLGFLFSSFLAECLVSGRIRSDVMGSHSSYRRFQPSKWINTSMSSSLMSMILAGNLFNHEKWAASWQNQQSDCAPSEDSESLLSAWRKLGSLATHWVHSEDSDQTGRMPRLIWVFAGCTSLCWFCHEIAQIIKLNFCNDPKFPDRQVLANSVDPVQTAPFICTLWTYYSMVKPYCSTGLSLELSDRKKISGRSLVQICCISYMFYKFKIPPQFKIGRSQPVRIFSPKLPPRLSPGSSLRTFQVSKFFRFLV